MNIDSSFLSIELTIGILVIVAGLTSFVSFKIVGRLIEIVGKLDSCIRRLDKVLNAQENINEVMIKSGQEHTQQMGRLNDIYYAMQNNGRTPRPPVKQE